VNYILVYLVLIEGPNWNKILQSETFKVRGGGGGGGGKWYIYEHNVSNGLTPGIELFGGSCVKIQKYIVNIRHWTGYGCYMSFVKALGVLSSNPGYNKIIFSAPKCLYLIWGTLSIFLNGIGVIYSGITRPWEWVEQYFCAPYVPSWCRHFPR